MKTGAETLRYDIRLKAMADEFYMATVPSFSENKHS